MDYIFEKTGKVGDKPIDLQVIQKAINALGIPTPNGIIIYTSLIKDDATIQAMKKDYDAKVSVATIKSKYPSFVKYKYTIQIEGLTTVEAEKVKTLIL